MNAILDLIITICNWIDQAVLNSFGKFMPDTLATFSFTLLIYTIGAFLNNKHHYVLKWILAAFSGIYSMYKIYVWQIVGSLTAVNTIFLIFLLIVYPFGLLFTVNYFKSWKIGPVHIFNYHFFWLVFISIALYYRFTDPAAISIEFCLLYAIISYLIVYCYGREENGN